MKILICDGYDAMSAAAASLIAAEIISSEKPVIGLATGSTPIGTYDELVRLYNCGALDFRHVKAFNLDEYIGLDRKNDQSYYYFMNNHLFSKVNIEDTNIPDGKCADCDEECVLYEQKIRDAGGIDIQLVGIGGNGHIGFNEPCGEFPENTHAVDLTEDTIRANSRFFEDIDMVPKRALTMGIGTIMRARKIVLIANGAGKAGIIKELLCGAITPSMPASILRLHPDVTVIVDKEAGSLL